MNKDYCFIVKLTDNCNMRCRYCYHFQHNTNHVYNNMQIEVVDKVIERLIEHNHQYAHFIWHGGEPLLMGLAFFEHIINKQKEVLRTNDKDIVISNGIQTNGTLLTRDTIDFLVENHFYIGLSLDGDEAMQSSDRGMPHNAFEDMMKSIDYLNDRQARYGILCVVGPDTLGKEQRLFDFYSQNNINNLGFLPLVVATKDGVDRNRTLSAEDFGKFLCNYFDIWVNSGIKGISIREFDDFIRYQTGFRKKMCTNTGECDLYYTVAPNGDIFPCDCFECSVENKLGNIMKSIGQLDNEDFIRNLSVQAHIRPQQCEMCLFKEMCQGGCAYYRWLSDEKLEKPSFYCIAFKMLYSHINSFMEA